MNAASASKSAAANRWQGIALTALQGLPGFTGSALLLKLFGARIVNQPGGAAIFIVTACAMLGVAAAWLAPKHPKFFGNYEPLFFDASLSVAQKVQGWLGRPATAKQLLQTLLMLTLLAIAVMTVR